MIGFSSLYLIYFVKKSFPRMSVLENKKGEDLLPCGHGFTNE